MPTTDINTDMTTVSALAKSGRFTEARTLCERLCRNNKKNPELWLLLGNLNKQLGALDRAEANFRKALRIKPGYAEAHTLLGMLQHSQGNFAAAAASYQRSLKRKPQQPPVRFNLGAVLQEQGRLKEAAEKYREAIQLKPDYAKAHANLAYLLRKQGKLDDALAGYQKAVRYAPEIVEIHFNMGSTLLQLGKADEAEVHQRKALQLNPAYVDAWTGLGEIQSFRGNYPAAITSYQKALNIDPDSVNALCGYANILVGQGAPEKALEHIQHAMDIEPGNVDARTALGSTFLSLGQPDKTLACCDRVLKTNPDHINAIVLSASAAEKKGDAKQAYERLKPVLETMADRVDAAIVFSLISKTLGREEEAIERMEYVLKKNNNLPDSDRCRLHFALGKAYDAKGEYDTAFFHYQSGNRLKRQNFNIIALRQKVDSLIKVQTTEFFANTPRSSIDSRLPVFIVGMPRSGTSLVEQILASHPEVFGAGELPNINNLVTSMHATLGTNAHYPECLTMVSQEHLDSMAQNHLDHLSGLSPDAARITDKMPSNFMHLGIIELLFPNASIIHCMRDPMDTCLSCYFQDFPQGHPYIYDLANLGSFYREYRRTMRHWKQTLKIPILDISYEELVSNQETLSRKLIEFCGLEWDENCLRFHENKRFIWTASYDQVRQPLYKNSIHRWKNYECHLSPLIKALEGM